MSKRYNLNKIETIKNRPISESQTVPIEAVDSPVAKNPILFKVKLSKSSDYLSTSQQLQKTSPQTLQRGHKALSTGHLPAPPTVGSSNRELGWRGVAALLLFAIIAVSTVYFVRQKLNEPFSPIGSAEQIATVTGTAFLGTVKPSSEVKIAAPTTAVVKNLFVKVGDKVDMGSPILQLDDKEAKAALAQAELDQLAADNQIAQINLTLGSLKKRTSSLKTELAGASGRVSVAQRKTEQVPVYQRVDSPERAQAVYDQALTRFNRAEDLKQKGLISEQEFDAAQAALKIAEADLRSAQKAAAASAELSKAQEEHSKLQSELADREQKQQIAELQGQLQQANLRKQQALQAIENARHKIEDLEIKATRDGVIVELPAKVGDLVVNGNTLVKLAKLDHLLVEVPINARIINALQPGQKAVVTLPNLGKQQIEGRVVTINPIPAQNLNHSVEVEFSNSSGAFLAGQSVEVKFLPKQ